LLSIENQWNPLDCLIARALVNLDPYMIAVASMHLLGLVRFNLAFHCFRETLLDVD
jgi:hypothetical protein